MDLGSECSAHETVEDNEAMTLEKFGNVDETKVETNGSCSDLHIDDQLLVEPKRGGIEVAEPVNSPSLTAKSPGGSAGSSPPVATKGYGLKKWKRIKRVVSKDGGSNVDSSKILKRGLPNPTGNSTDPVPFSAEMKQKGKGFVSSTNAAVRSPVVGADGFSLIGDSGLEVGPIFAAGTDSENSEDQSSKSSTAASAPKLRFETPAVVGYASDKNRMRSLSGKNFGSLVQRGQQGRSWIEISKKPRGEQVKIEKENSHSSMESDSRSSNFVFMQGANSVTSNGRHSARSAEYGGENSVEAQGSEQQFSEGPQLSYSRKLMGEYEDVSLESLAADYLSWEVKEAKCENHSSTTDRDPFVESILTLQTAKEALEKEIQKFRDIGKEDIVRLDDSIEGGSLPSEFTSTSAEVYEPNLVDQLQSSPLYLETQVICLKEKVKILETKLEEAEAVLKMKEAKVVELEANLNGSLPEREKTRSTMELQGENYREMDIELESLFRQKIEAEVEYLAILRTIQNLRVAAVDQMTLLEEQNIVASKQAQMVNKLGAAERTATVLKRQAEELGTRCEDIVESDEVLKLQNRVFKFTSIFFLQLMLLLVVLGLFVLRSSSHHAGVVPT